MVVLNPLTYGYFWPKTRKIKLQGKRWWIAIYCKLCVFVAQSYIPSSLLACCQHILVLLLHILWRGCYVAWYYYHQFLVLLLKLFVSWPHHTALRTMMKVTTVEWSVWIVGSVCLCIFLACKEGIDRSQINITWMSLVSLFSWIRTSL